MRRCFWLGLLVLVLPATAAGQGDPKKPRIRAGFSDTFQVGFALLDKDGKPQRLTFDDKGGTNVVVVRIDDKDYAFGFEGGAFKAKNVPLGKDRIGSATTWAVDKVEVTQAVETVQGKSGEWDVCVVSYTIVNKDVKPHAVGLRVMLDTHLGDKAKQIFQAAGAKDVVNDKADWKGPEVPAVLRTMQKPPPDEGLTATFTFKRPGQEAPDRVVLTAFPERDTAFGWDLPVKNMDGDAVIGMYWSPRELKPLASRAVGYGYGAGEPK
jgi:hypothetical protein